MRKGLFKSALAASVGAGLLALGASPAAAAELSVVPDHVVGNGQILLTGQEFQPNDTVVITIVAPDGSQQTLSVGTDGAGQFATVITPNQAGENGMETITAIGTGTAFEAQATVEVGNVTSPVVVMPAPVPMPASEGAVPLPAAPATLAPASAPAISGRWTHVMDTGTDVDSPGAGDDALESASLPSGDLDASQFPLPSSMPSIAAAAAASALQTEPAS